MNIILCRLSHKLGEGIKNALHLVIAQNLEMLRLDHDLWSLSKEIREIQSGETKDARHFKLANRIPLSAFYKGSPYKHLNKGIMRLTPG